MDLGASYSVVNVKVLSLNGQLISIKEISNSEKINLEIEGETGLYFIVITTSGNKKATIKILKE